MSVGAAIEGVRVDDICEGEGVKHSQSHEGVFIPWLLLVIPIVGNV